MHRKMAYMHNTKRNILELELTFFYIIASAKIFEPNSVINIETTIYNVFKR